MEADFLLMFSEASVVPLRMRWSGSHHDSEGVEAEDRNQWPSGVLHPHSRCSAPPLLLRLTVPGKTFIYTYRYMLVTTQMLLNVTKLAIRISLLMSLFSIPKLHKYSRGLSSGLPGVHAPCPSKPLIAKISKASCSAKSTAAFVKF